MLNLFYLSESWRFILILLGLTAFASQAVLLVLLMYRSRQAGRLLSAKTLELLGLISIGFLTHQLVLVGFNSSAGLVFLPLSPVSIYSLGLLFLLLGSLVFYQEGHWASLLPALALVLLLPCWGKSTCFQLLFSLSFLIFFFRSSWLVLYWHRILNSSLSDLSVLQALDNLPSGILFYAEDGYIHLQNKAMSKLVFCLLGQPVRDGHEIYARLKSGPVLQGERQHVYKEAVIFQLADQSIWRFKHDLVPVGPKTYHQLTAMDLTGQWQLTAELAGQKEKLLAQKAELEKMLADLSRLSSRKEQLLRKNRVHDVIGQRVALVQNALRSETADLAAIGQSLASLAADLARDNEPVAKTLRQMISSFASVGVKVLLQGEPDQTAAGLLLLDLIREAVSNAVRHGLASEIKITCQEEAGRYVLTITNNGSTPAFITEGGGIRALREKVKPFAGQIKIQTRPQFVLTARLNKQADGGYPQ